MFLSISPEPPGCPAGCWQAGSWPVTRGEARVFVFWRRHWGRVRTGVTPGLCLDQHMELNTEDKEISFHLSIYDEQNMTILNISNEHSEKKLPRYQSAGLNMRISMLWACYEKLRTKIILKKCLTISSSRHA